MKILLTGIAGFIGYHLAKRLLDENYEIVGVDNINNYYSQQLKYDRLNALGVNRKTLKSQNPLLTFRKIDISNTAQVNKLFEQNSFDYVITLAGQPGVRYQFENAYSYVSSNIVGFVNILEAVRNHPVKHFIYASSSSVYGLILDEVFCETDAVDHPASLYAATKRANELIAHSYSNLFNIPTTGLRFFTVYGPWYRPDMYLYKLADSIVKGKELMLYEQNNQSLWRDYTYIDDILEGIVRLLPLIPSKSKDISKPNISTAPFAIYNIGKGHTDKNSDIVSILEELFGKKANIKHTPAPNTELFRTSASTDSLFKAVGYKPKVSIGEGLIQFALWYKEYYS
jgi:UDP-glucuronate 4-epimerase